MDLNANALLPVSVAQKFQAAIRQRLISFREFNLLSTVWQRYLPTTISAHADETTSRAMHNIMELFGDEWLNHPNGLHDLLDAWQVYAEARGLDEERIAQLASWIGPLSMLRRLSQLN